ncbi:hypothetical protein CTAYLR_010301 [Chrysophaeum taylorii]|uniref:MYG1 protein n=1 Tax=Chrysophaeum taylorii TaxID=2483200 RepID=A0AAD7UJA0_9STRA|nr:hypothetical protein CTAYLR_010301 [Chrysophaeum taylorii]
MLKMVPEFESASVVRTRDPAVLERCDVVVDVGGVYEPAKRRFDHHQRGFEETMTELGRSTKLSSAGLAYRHYGREVIATILSARGESLPKKPRADDSSFVDKLYPRLYASFVEEIDGIDNGQEAFYDAATPRYELSTTLSRRVGRLNARWNQPQHDQNNRFGDAVRLCSAELVDACLDALESWLPARDIVARALSSSTGEIVDLETYCPWQAHIFDLETEPGRAKYVLYEDSKGGWRVQAVPVQAGSFKSRLPLPEPWRGLRDDHLSALVGVQGCIFVHASGFIGGAKTKDAVMALATKALEFAGAI